MVGWQDGDVVSLFFPPTYRAKLLGHPLGTLCAACIGRAYDNILWVRAADKSIFDVLGVEERWAVAPIGQTRW